MGESTETAYRMEGAAFRLTDGIIHLSGLTIDVAETTSDPNLVIISVSSAE